MSFLVKHSFSLSGHRTSVALEQEFWNVLDNVAAGRVITLARLVALVDSERSPDRPLASALRIFALRAVS